MESAHAFRRVARQ